MFARKKKAQFTPSGTETVQQKGISMPAVPYLKASLGKSEKVTQLMYNNSAGRGQFWHARNALAPGERRFDPTDLPADFKQKSWRGNPFPQDRISAFISNGRLDASLPDNLAKQAYLGPAGRGERAINIELHDRIYSEHVAETNAKAEAESLRRYNEAPGSLGLNYPRTFSWVIGGAKSEFRSAARSQINAGKAVASIYGGAQQLGLNLTLSTRQVDLERKSFKTRPEAIHAGAKSILAEEGSSVRVTGVVIEKGGGNAVSSFTGPWNVANNTWQVYHYAAGGANGADALLSANKLVGYRSPAHGTEALINATEMPHAGVAEAGFE